MLTAYGMAGCPGCHSPDEPKHEVSIMKYRIFRILSAAVLAVWIQQGAHAADTPDVSPTTDKLAQARTHIKAGQWTAAIDELRRVNDTASADWNNLMGYSLRKARTPDLESAERHYNEALRINPSHRGALEYSGELYLMKGDLAGAERRLAVLDKACMFGCEEYTDLKKEIARFKAAGNKYMAPQ
jgi:tetratricopeptide (TPR) repeat protein